MAASRKSSGQNHRSTLSLQRTEITINVYDLLPPGKVATVLWTIGSSLLHSGVVIGDREYAYGGHDRRGLTGVYWTKPAQEPPGGTFRQSILHGFSFRPAEELDAIIHEASEEFQGTSYNLLTKNCNHFTSYLCEKLTGRPAPGWVNRAASIGVALPCVVPREWIAPPDYDTADGELLDEDFDERSSMLRHGEHQHEHQQQQQQQHQGRYRSASGEADRQAQGQDTRGAGSSSRSEQGGPRGNHWHSAPEHGPRVVNLKDTDSSGHKIPAAERAPLPKNLI